MIGNVIQPNGAVSGGGETYASTETVIGTWMGKTLYRKCYEIEQTISAGDSYTIQDTFSQDKIVTLGGTVYCTSDGTYRCVPLPSVFRNDVTYQTAIQIDGNGHPYISVGTKAFQVLGLKVIIEYTKS